MVEVILPPDYLLQSPCKAKGTGDKVSTLAKGYVHNTNCIQQYEATLQATRDWKVKQQSLNKTKEEK